MRNTLEGPKILGMSGAVLRHFLKFLVPTQEFENNFESGSG
jgi:hypothetical protein